MAKQTLLQKAIQLKKKSNKTNIYDPKELQELSLAWVRNEVKLSDIAKSLGLPNTGHQTYAKIALSLKDYINQNNQSIPQK